jgi:hypothetical protein
MLDAVVMTVDRDRFSDVSDPWTRTGQQAGFAFPGSNSKIHGSSGSGALGLADTSQARRMQNHETSQTKADDNPRLPKRLNWIT